MKRLVLALFAMLPLSPALAASGSIIEVTPGVTVVFPGDPQHRDEPHTGGDIYQYAGSQGDERFALVAVGMTAPGDLSDAEAGEAFEGVSESYERRGTIVMKERIRYQSHPAARFEARLDNGQRVRSLSVVKGNTVNTLNWITAADTSLPDSLGDSFFDSLNMGAASPSANAAGSGTPAPADTATPQQMELDPREIGRTVGKSVAIVVTIAIIIAVCILIATRRRRSRQSR